MNLFEEIVNDFIKQGRNKKYNTEEWINVAKQIRGNNYDYSKVNYVDAKTKVLIGCPVHGYFLVKPIDFLRGQSCPKCSHPSKMLSTEEFIEKARKIHGDKYNYSNVEYSGKNKPICIICPEHGEFWQTPHTHLTNHGCPTCAKEKNRKKLFLTTEKFIEKAHKVHGNRYGYSKVDYKKFDIPVIISCQYHGDFEQKPVNHLQGYGCPKCGIEKNISEQRLLNVIKNNFGDNNVIYQYSSEWLKNGVGVLKIDIFIKNLNIGIEYQGKQHFEPVEHYGGKEHYDIQVERDKRKYLLCKEHNITLLYFSYEKKNYF